MQRNILKIVLACGMAFFLAATPINTLNAAEPTVNTDSQSTDASELRETYYVNAQHGLKVRSAPSKDSDIVTLLPYGAEVIVIGTANNSWYEIEYSNESAYVSADYITKSSEGADTDSDVSETDESIPSTMSSLENVKTTLGATPVIFALIAAIIIMILLAIFTAYSFLKKDKDNHNEYNDDDHYDCDDHNDYDDSNYNNDSEEYIDEEYDDDEFYDDEE